MAGRKPLADRRWHSRCAAVARRDGVQSRCDGTAARSGRTGDVSTPCDVMMNRLLLLLVVVMEFVQLEMQLFA